MVPTKATPFAQLRSLLDTSNEQSIQKTVESYTLNINPCHHDLPSKVCKTWDDFSEIFSKINNLRTQAQLHQTLNLPEGICIVSNGSFCIQQIKNMESPLFALQNPQKTKQKPTRRRFLSQEEKNIISITLLAFIQLRQHLFLIYHAWSGADQAHTDRDACVLSSHFITKWKNTHPTQHHKKRPLSFNI